jgi:hypothetical protein
VAVLAARRAICACTSYLRAVPTVCVVAVRWALVAAYDTEQTERVERRHEAERGGEEVARGAGEQIAQGKEAALV